MAVGRQDYWGGFYTLESAGGEKPAIWVKNQSLVLAADSIGTFFTYTVPDGYNLYVRGLSLSAELPGNMWFRIVADVGDDFYTWFDGNIFIHVPFGLLEVQTPGSDIIAQVANVDLDKSMTFYLTLYGALERISS